jgi:hypothetical protein
MANLHSRARAQYGPIWGTKQAQITKTPEILAEPAKKLFATVIRLELGNEFSLASENKGLSRGGFSGAKHPVAEAGNRWGARDRRSNLFEFDQGSGAIVGVQEQDRLAMRPDFRDSISEDARACPFQLLTRRNNVGDLETEMMDRPVRMFSQKFGDRGILAERFDKLDFGVFELDERHCHAMSRQGHGPAHPGAERVAINRA